MINQNRIAVTSRSFSRHKILRQELLSKYPNVQFNEAGLNLVNEELISFLDGAEKAIIGLENFDGSTLDRLPNLKVISKYGVGLDMLDLEAMVERGVRLGWTGGVNRRAVSELVITFAISLLRKIPSVTYEVRNGTWRQTVGHQLSDQCVGIIGCGFIGQDLAKLLRAFGSRVVVYDIRDLREFCGKHDVEQVNLETLLRCANIVSIHLPLDPMTENFLSADRLATMPTGSFLINAARGGLIDEIAAMEMLKRGRLGGAAFDVLNEEPPSNMDLINLPNVIVTPHIGGSAEEAILNMGRAAIDGLEKASVPERGATYWPN